MTHEDHHENEDYDASRYESASGWQPKNPLRKQIDDYRKRNPDEFCGNSLLETRNANKWLTSGAANNPPANLFGNLWRAGELAVLFAGSGAGKSVLAVQIAESIARGRNALSENGKLKTENADHQHFSPFTFPISPAPAQPVLYLDLQHSPAQFTERYSCPSPVPGKLPVKYRFSSNLRFSRIGEIDIPESFNGDLARYFDHSLNRTLALEDTKIIVIDNLSWLDLRTSGPAAAIRRLRSLKLYCITTGASILVLDSSPPGLGGVAAPRGRGGSSGLRIPNSALRIYEVADSVFAIGRSTFSEEIRYVKLLKSSSPRSGVGSPQVSNGLTGRPEPSPIAADPGEVLTYQLSRSTTLIPHSAIATPQPEGPFLGFTYLGPSAETDHLIDYAGQARQIKTRERKALNRRHNVTDMFLDREYWRYLEK